MNHTSTLRGPLPRTLACLLAAQVFLAPAVHAESPTVDAVDLLAKADAIRFPKQDFQVEVSINTHSPGHTADVREYEILSKGNDQTLVKTTAPAVDRGQIMLMKGRDLWVYMPNVSQPIRLPLAQRLTGQVANGDLARANFTGDYAPVWLREEQIENQSFHVLELRAVDRGVTYHRVLYWINKANQRPYQAEFYAVSGRLLKTCRYENFINMDGQLRPSRLVMTDALHRDEVSVLEYRDLHSVSLPDKYFTKDYLKKLE